jgi:GNAT superfamily N-acetyltransferase
VSEFTSVEVLTADHETDDFDCGSPAQTDWLRSHGLQAQLAGTSRVFVVCGAGGKRVVGYHALAAGSVEHADSPDRLRRGVGRHPIPVVILTRMGVDLSQQGRGLGAALVKDALQRTIAAAHEIGVRALLIHAETQEARAFYMHLAEFELSPTDPLHLYLLMKDLRATIEST